MWRNWRFSRCRQGCVTKAEEPAETSCVLTPIIAVHAHRQPPRRSAATPSEGEWAPVADPAAGKDRVIVRAMLRRGQCLADMADGNAVSESTGR